ncbi:MAG: redox-sensing transcriptional repressor Rex [Oscillospiraceae bacterium]|nr:redox-sensing transcriptional repressor Rex [Oscillospiraceae bacterium]
MRKTKISHNVILRLPRYLRYLEELRNRGVVRTSSGELGRLMGVTPSQIRQDLSCYGEFGQQGYGYNVEMLMNAISDILGTTRERKAVIIGAGNLGRAIIGKFPFEQYGFRLTGAYDLADSIIGTEIADLTVRHIDRLEEDIRETRTEVAVLTMSSASANAIAGRLIDAGVRGIWNFTNVDLTISSPSVVVENLHFSDSLLTLSYYMTHGKSGEQRTDD